MLRPTKQWRQAHSPAFGKSHHGSGSAASLLLVQLSHTPLGLRGAKMLWPLALPLRGCGGGRHERINKKWGAISTRGAPSRLVCVVVPCSCELSLLHRSRSRPACAMAGEETARELRQVGTPLLTTTLVSRGTHSLFHSYDVPQKTTTSLSTLLLLFFVFCFFQQLFSKTKPKSSNSTLLLLLFSKATTAAYYN